MKPIRLTWIALFAIFSFVPPPSFSATVERIEATVNSEMISTSDLERAREAYLQSLKSDTPPRASNPELTRAVLERLIEEQLIKQEIRRLGLTLSPAELNQRIDSFKRSYGIQNDEELRAALRNQGLSFEEWRTQLKTQIELGNYYNYVRGPNPVVSEEDLRSYYRNHRSEFMEREARHLRLIFIPENGSAQSKSADSLLSRIKSGPKNRIVERFAEAARDQSNQHPAGPYGGDVGFVEKGEFMPELNDSVFSARALVPGKITTGKGTYLYIVEEIRPARQRPFEAVRTEIEQRFTEREAETRVAAAIQKLRQNPLNSIIIHRNDVSNSGS